MYTSLRLLLVAPSSDFARMSVGILAFGAISFFTVDSFTHYQFP